MTQEHECPTCDYTSDTQMGISVHHHHKHGESIAKSTYECDVCGESFERYDCNLRGEDTFCSRECEAEYRSNLPQEEQAAWKGGKATVECAMCGGEKQVKQYRVDRSERFFCDHDCYADWKAENTSGPDNPSFCSIEVDCDWCGESTYKLESRIERSKRDFCSHDCHSKWEAENLTGPKAHKWTGGRRDYGVGWNDEKKEAVRERDNRECHDCGKTEAQSIAEHGRQLDVHHLVPPDSDTNPAVHNAKRNLVTLCIQCHQHRESYSPPTAAIETAKEVCES